MVINLTFNTRPAVIHAQAHLEQIPFWQPIRDAFFALPPQQIGAIEDLTILTWNNGHHNMGLLEQSLDRLGVPCLVLGQGIEEWINSKHKPLLTRDALGEITTKYVMGIDSRDAIVIRNPQAILDTFRQEFDCELVFSGDRLNWPNIDEFKVFEEALPGAKESEFRYLNSGIWIGTVEFCREFYTEAVRTPPIPESPESEQGILKQLFARYYPRVQLDYQCKMFQNIGFVFAPILEIGDFS